MSSDAPVNVPKLSSDLTSLIASGQAKIKEKLEPQSKARSGQRFCCPWHRQGVKGHGVNYGLSMECLDCMENIKAGFCEIDVKNFDLDIYWCVKRYWDKVDIKGEDECWPWLGAMRKKGGETAAYFPSPHHNADTQSAARVAFWTSRGYTGKLRVMHQPGCHLTCCNPRHLQLREVESVPVPKQIKTINLKYGNIFERAKEARRQSESGTGE